MFIIDFVETGKNVITSASDGVIFDVAKENIGLFEKCTVRTSEWEKYIFNITYSEVIAIFHLKRPFPCRNQKEPFLKANAFPTLMI